MRAVVQRVISASVTGEVCYSAQRRQLTSSCPVDNEVISSIGRGVMILVGIGTGLPHSITTNAKSENA